MSDLHDHETRDSKMSTLILVSIIILGLLYFLAKGCTNQPENEHAPGSHGTVMNVTAIRLL